MSKSEIIQRFGEKLRLLREARNMRQTELAHLLGHVSHGYISEIESGKKMPTLEFALKAARLFDVSLDILAKDELELDFVNHSEA